MTTGRRTFARTPRRARQWAIGPTVGGSIVVANQAGQLTFDLLNGLETDLGMQLHNVTVSALRYNVSYRLTTAQSTDDVTIAMGIGWVSQEAIDVGGTSLPDPSTDHYDWMFHDVRTISGTGTTDQDEMPRGAFWSIENNSMRKQRENHSSLVAIYRAVLMQSAAVQVFID